MADPVAPELVAATEAALERHGWAGLTGELLADAAGLNRVTLYRRGHTPQRLLAAAVEAAAAEFRAASLAPLTHAGTAAERLRLLVDALFDLADRHLALLAGLYDGPTAVFHLGGLGATANASGEAVTRFEYTEPFERILRDGNADATLTTSEPHRDAVLIFNAAGWTYIHLRRSHGLAAADARDAVHGLVERYVLPRDG